MKIVAFTGAGISKSAGIPTFEEIEGLKESLTLEFKTEYPEEYKQIRQAMIDNMKDKEPTIAHKALAEYNIPIITMNIDALHTKAGSKLVYQIHGNYIYDNIVLYGQEILFREESMNLVLQTAKKAKKDNEKAIFLVIGTSMQTMYANVLVWVAKDNGMEVHYINENADEEVPKFLKKHLKTKNIDIEQIN